MLSDSGRLDKDPKQASWHQEADFWDVWLQDDCFIIGKVRDGWCLCDQRCPSWGRQRVRDNTFHPNQVERRWVLELCRDCRSQLARELSRQAEPFRREAICESQRPHRPNQQLEWFRSWWREKARRRSWDQDRLLIKECQSSFDVTELHLQASILNKEP